MTMSPLDTDRIPDFCPKWTGFPPDVTVNVPLLSETKPSVPKSSKFHVARPHCVPPQSRFPDEQVQLPPAPGQHGPGNPDEVAEPQSVHVVPEQVSPELHTLPAQHAWPEAPHGLHVPPEQKPVVHEVPPQHAWKASPHWQVLLPPHERLALQPVLQQVWPEAPHGLHTPFVQA